MLLPKALPQCHEGRRVSWVYEEKVRAWLKNLLKAMEMVQWLKQLPCDLDPELSLWILLWMERISS